jgi:hypothetical protein
MGGCRAHSSAARLIGSIAAEGCTPTATDDVSIDACATISAMEFIKVDERMKRSGAKHTAIKLVSDESPNSMTANKDGNRESETLRSLHNLHRALVAHSITLKRAISGLAAVIQTDNHAPTKNFVSSSDSGEAAPAEYPEVKRKIKELVNDVLPPDAVLVVVSKGDEELLELGGRIGGHFPQTEDGRYTGYHPKTSDEAVLQLEEVRFRGAEYFLLPYTAFWWIDHYVEFKQYLDKHYRLATKRTDACFIYDLSETESKPRAPHAYLGGKVSQYLQTPRDQDDHAQIRKAVNSALPADAIVAVVSKGDDALLDLGTRVARHFPPPQPGRPAGICPDERTNVVESLKDMCETGVQYLLFPATTLWWLDHDGDLKQYLDAHAKLLLKHPACSVWDIRREKIEQFPRRRVIRKKTRGNQ